MAFAKIFRANKYSGKSSAIVFLSLICAVTYACRRNSNVTGVFEQTCPVGGGGGRFCSLANSRITGRNEDGRDEVFESSQVALLRGSYKFTLKGHKLGKGQVKCQNGFALSATKTALMTAANPNCVKRLPKG